METRSYTHIGFERNGRVLTVSLNRPEKLNAVNALMHTELARVFHDIAADPDSDIVILTGSGRAFCAGGDLEFLESAREDPVRLTEVLRETRSIVMAMLDCDKPIICRMNGDAVGLGATLALLCDVIVAVESARIIDPHVRVGLVAGDGGALIWPQLVGYARAKRYLLTGDPVPAPEALAMGLITATAAADALDGEVASWVARLSANSPMAVRWSKATINTGLKQLAATIMDTGVAYEGMSFRSDDLGECIAAMREKRKPVFKGR